MNYFKEISDRCDEITEKASKYLEGLPFIPNDEVVERIWKKALEIGEKHGLTYNESGSILFENLKWENLPEWAASSLDGWVPYSVIPKNGSIYFSLAFSVVSQEAHLRNLLEIVEGRETKELDFPVIVPKKELALFKTSC